MTASLMLFILFCWRESTVTPISDTQTPHSLFVPKAPLDCCSTPCRRHEPAPRKHISSTPLFRCLLLNQHQDGARPFAGLFHSAVSPESQLSNDEHLPSANGTNIGRALRALCYTCGRAIPVSEIVDTTWLTTGVHFARPLCRGPGKPLQVILPDEWRNAQHMASKVSILEPDQRQHEPNRSTLS